MTRHRTPSPRIFARLFILVVLSFALFALARSAEAETTVTLVVTKTADTNDGKCDSDCSLREAMDNANTNTGSDLINFNIPASDSACSGLNICSLTLGSPLPPVTDPDRTSIIGPGSSGKITIDGAGNQIFSVSVTGSLALRQLTVMNGKAASGAALVNGGVVQITESTFSNNQVAGGSGGAIYNYGVLDIQRATFVSNVATDDVGGAIHNETGLLTVENSTFTANSATAGGAIYADSGGVTHSTFYRNTADNGGAVADEGSAASLNLTNTLLDGSIGGSCYTVSGGIIADDDGNISSDASCAFTAPNSVNSKDPQLDPALADNGGLTQTHALLPGSPAIDTAAAAACLPTDQRSQHRPSGLACDKGAYEFAVPLGPNLVVNTTADDDDGFCDALVPGFFDCTLPEAVQLADAQSGDNSITFDIPASDSGCSAANDCTILLSSTLPTINDPTGVTTIDGSGANIIIDGNGTSRFAHVDSAFVLRRLEITNGHTSSGTQGGAIISHGADITIEHTTFSGNFASGPGGAIYLDSQGTLTIDNSTFHDNEAGTSGGAIASAGTLIVSNSTFYRNLAAEEGGVIAAGYDNNTILVTNSTFYQNRSYDFGGAIYAYAGTINGSTFYNNGSLLGGTLTDYDPSFSLTVINSIVANSNDDNCGVRFEGLISDDGGNISDDATCGFSGDKIDPLLDPNLADNGGPTLTQALFTSSPAIRAGVDPCLSLDQRGASRPPVAGCDSGAFEYQNASAIQYITLYPGWNMISSYVQPENSSLAMVISNMTGEMVLAKDGQGQVYWPAFGINQVRVWDVRNGYQVYMADQGTLPIFGYVSLPPLTPIELDTGWNQISYSRSEPLSVIDAFAGISSDLLLVKDGTGGIYWPDLEINDIGDLQPGQGYQVYMSSSAVFLYPENW